MGTLNDFHGNSTHARTRPAASLDKSLDLSQMGHGRQVENRIQCIYCPKSMKNWQAGNTCGVNIKSMHEGPIT